MKGLPGFICNKDWLDIYQIKSIINVGKELDLDTLLRLIKNSRFNSTPDIWQVDTWQI